MSVVAYEKWLVANCYVQYMAIYFHFISILVTLDCLVILRAGFCKKRIPAVASYMYILISFLCITNKYCTLTPLPPSSSRLISNFSSIEDLLSVYLCAFWFHTFCISRTVRTFVVVIYFFWSPPIRVAAPFLNIFGSNVGSGFGSLI